MPALPDKPSRRKYSTPRAKSDAEDVWKRTFNIMGLELLSSNKEQSRTTTMATASYISPPQDASLAQGSEKKKMTILELPSETQKDIFKYVSTVCGHLPVLSMKLRGLTMYLPVRPPRPHCPLPCIETFQRDCCGTIVPNLPYYLPRFRGHPE
jgi:hypothetical protein